ncbi:hypothetical protein [Shewanella algae]|uniref:hypothetical protein n=1 Tax=Shewanella algae TaxID=38313 RepID=UPI001AAC5CF7|nr:hypothetical protein [Shewanella algae]MBO2579147.1 hypothetical protein [Shewanella algae]MBO2684631.1 hypothetical protein [Shewanella algae]BCV64337.1 hypothetical protein TUM17386_40080 [Shewanella algae]
MTVFLTVFAGALTFVVGQLVLKLIIEPVQELNKTISKIAYDLIKLANVFANPTSITDDKMASACQIMREHSSSLHASLYLVPKYRLMYKLFGLPPEDKILEATKQLIRLYNGHDHVLDNQGILNTYTMQKIKQNLGIKIPKDELLDPKLEREFIRAK